MKTIYYYKMAADNIHVESYIDDSVPKNLPVKVEIDA